MLKATLLRDPHNFWMVSISEQNASIHHDILTTLLARNHIELAPMLPYMRKTGDLLSDIIHIQTPEGLEELIL